MNDKTIVKNECIYNVQINELQKGNSKIIGVKQYDFNKYK